MGDGAAYGKVIRENENYFFVPNYNQKEKISIAFSGKSKFIIKDGVLERKINQGIRPKPKV